MDDTGEHDEWISENNRRLSRAINISGNLSTARHVVQARKDLLSTEWERLLGFQSLTESDKVNMRNALVSRRHRVFPILMNLTTSFIPVLCDIILNYLY